MNSTSGTQAAILNGSEVAVVGVARNCAKTIRKDVLRLQASLAFFGKIHFLIIESDSSDRTLSEFEYLSSRISNFRFITLGPLMSDFPLRSERVAYCRNRYISEILSGQNYKNVDYVIVADLDGINNAIDQSGFLSCWTTDTAWDVCTANQLDYYYDIWALRHPTWCPTDCWKTYEQLLPLLGSEQALEVAVHSKMVRLERRNRMIEVCSAFGGLAVYKRHVLTSSRYTGVSDDGSTICEHVTFHAGIRSKGYKIYINPAMISAKSTDHSIHKKRLAKAFRTVFPNIYAPDPDGIAPQRLLRRFLKGAKMILK
jgi:hypothetical protein